MSGISADSTTPGPVLIGFECCSARDWRALLFPTAADDVFADGYAQAVTFALLLARSEGLALDAPLHEIGDRLDRAQHSLMGRALQLLTDHVAADFKVTLGLLGRVVGAAGRRGRSSTLTAARRTPTPCP